VPISRVWPRYSGTQCLFYWVVLTHSPNHLLTHSPNHLLTHSLT
jgi:hypothetical protein